MIKALNKLGMKGHFLNSIKGLCEKPTAINLLNGERLKTFPVSTCATTIQHGTRESSQNN